MTAAQTFQESNQRAHEEADVRRLQLLRYIAKRHNTVRWLIQRSGWHERTVNRYLVELHTRGLVTRTRDSEFGAQGVWFWRYALTEAGRRAIAGG